MTQSPLMADAPNPTLNAAPTPEPPQEIEWAMDPEAAVALGSPDAASVTLPVNPPRSVTVMVSVAVLP